MNKCTQIDWSQVMPGKTWLESPNGCQCRVDAVMGEDVWVYYQDGKYPSHQLSWTKSSIASCKWRIRGEWEDVTGECEIIPWWCNGVWLAVVKYKGKFIDMEEKTFKLDGTKKKKRRTH